MLLQHAFRLGIFSSATERTVSAVIPMLHATAGDGPQLFDPTLVLHRAHTQAAPSHHIAAGGKAWDNGQTPVALVQQVAPRASAG